jgi:hypothetical protein
VSATNRSDVRDGLDRYDTPEWCVRRLLDADPLFAHPYDGGRWLEPSVGAGMLIHAVDVWRNGAGMLLPHWTAVDLRIRFGAARGIALHWSDFLTWEPPTSQRYDVCVGNPPYSLAFEFAQKCVALADTAALLLRLNWLASAKRADWIREHTPSIYVLPNRPSFTGKGSDATDYAWFVWRKDVSPEVRILATTPASERRGT